MNVNIVAVSKYHTKEEIDAVAKEGLITFGENRVQEFLENMILNINGTLLDIFKQIK